MLAISNEESDWTSSVSSSACVSKYDVRSHWVAQRDPQLKVARRGECQFFCTSYKFIAASGGIGETLRGECIAFPVLCLRRRAKDRSLAEAAESLEISRDSQMGADVFPGHDLNGWLPSDARIES